MKTPTFIEGALVGLVAAVGASIAHLTLTLALPGSQALATLIIGLGIAYCLYLLGRSRERAGRLVMVTLWGAITALAWGLSPGPWTQILVQCGMVWLVRSLYHQPTALAALLDGALIAAGLAASGWAAVHTGSLLLAVWCLFLVQALFGGIRSLLPTPDGAASGSADRTDPPDPFDLAFRAAQRATARLTHRPPTRA